MLYVYGLYSSDRSNARLAAPPLFSSDCHAPAPIGQRHPMRLFPRVLFPTQLPTPPNCLVLKSVHANPATEQVCFFSATLHSPEIAKLSESICDRPTWVDLKGRDSVPETVHHVLVRVDPDRDGAALMRAAPVQARTDGAAVGRGSEGREEERADRLKQLKPQVWCFVYVFVAGKSGGKLGCTWVCSVCSLVFLGTNCM